MQNNEDNTYVYLHTVLLCVRMLARNITFPITFRKESRSKLQRIKRLYSLSEYVTSPLNILRLYITGAR
jgi:hypothetical protein